MYLAPVNIYVIKSNNLPPLWFADTCVSLEVGMSGFDSGGGTVFIPGYLVRAMNASQIHQLATAWPGHIL